MKRPDWTRRTLPALLEEQTQRHPERTYLLFADQKITYGELGHKSKQLASGLWEMGVRKGDKVALMLWNCPQFLYCWLGCATLGAILVPINCHSKGDQLEYILSNSDSSVLVLSADLLSRIQPLIPNLPKIRSILVTPEVPDCFAAPGKTVLKFDDLLCARGEFSPPEVRFNDLSAIMYTSGTTGPSRGAVVTHNYFFEIGQLRNRGLRSSHRDVLYTCLPLFHANALVYSAFPALQLGATLAIKHGFNVHSFWDEVQFFGATEFNSIGSMLTLLYKQPPREDDANNPIRATFSIGAPKDIWRKFERRFCLKIVEGYGQTEVFVSLNPWHKGRVGAVGKPHKGYRVEVIDDAGLPVAPGLVGEIVVRPTRPFSMFEYYYNAPEKTMEVFRGLWHHTGDRGYFDKDGFLYFVDRKKDCIRRRGENISSFEVEKIVNTHPAVLESAAVGVPSELGEEEIKICVVLRPGQSVSPEALLDFCSTRMAYFMVPRYVGYRDSLPKTPSEKVEKYKLRMEALTLQAWDREAAGYRVRKDA